MNQNVPRQRPKELDSFESHTHPRRARDWGSIVVQSHDVALEHPDVALWCTTLRTNDDSIVLRELKLPQVIQVETAIVLGDHQVARSQIDRREKQSQLIVVTIGIRQIASLRSSKIMGSYYESVKDPVKSGI